MKKILAVVLALTMIVGMSIPAFAADLNKDLNDDKMSENYAVTVTYVPNGTHVLGADVVWSGISFTYNQGSWNPDLLDYESGWENDVTSKNGTITVTNLSNTDLKVTVGWTEALTGATAEFKIDDTALATDTLDAVEGKVTDAVTFDVTVDVSEATAPTASGNVGTITVTIADASLLQ